MKRVSVMPLILVVILSGCMSTRRKADDFYPWIFPTSTFEREGEFCAAGFKPKEEILKESGTNDYANLIAPLYSYEALYRDFGTNEAKRIINDPFTTQACQYVTFLCPSDPTEMFHYYDRLFRADGWSVVREPFGTEHECSLGRGICVLKGRVYSKGRKLVRFAILGHTGEEDPHPDRCLIWEINLSFINMHPRELLGPHYREKGREAFSMAYHVYVPIYNQKHYRFMSGRQGTTVLPGHKRVEALAWLESNNYKNGSPLAGNRFKSKADAIQFVKKLYALGATSVFVSRINEDPGLLQYSGGPISWNLVVGLPVDKEKRAALFRIEREEMQPFDAIEDEGFAELLLLWN